MLFYYFLGSVLLTALCIYKLNIWNHFEICCIFCLKQDLALLPELFLNWWSQPVLCLSIPRSWDCQWNAATPHFENIWKTTLEFFSTKEFIWIYFLIIAFLFILETVSSHFSPKCWDYRHEQPQLAFPLLCFLFCLFWEGVRQGSTQPALTFSYSVVKDGLELPKLWVEQLCVSKENSAECPLKHTSAALPSGNTVTRVTSCFISVDRIGSFERP